MIPRYVSTNSKTKKSKNIFKLKQRTESFITEKTIRAKRTKVIKGKIFSESYWKVNEN